MKMDDDDEEEVSETPANIAAGVALAAALLVLAFQFLIANTWINADDNPKKGDWSQLLGSE
jgi:hypothetical protein